MTDPENGSGGGAAVPPLDDLANAMTDFVSQFNIFRGEEKSKISEQEKLMTQLERKS